MARDGSGNHSLPEAAFVSGTTIESAKVNSNFSDISSALTGSIAKDGQTVPTANLPMGGFKHTNVAVATSRTDYARASQIADNSMGYAASSGTDTITATPAPGISAYAIGQRFTLKKDANANTGAVTLNINSIGAGAVTWPDGTALAAGDLPANCAFEVVVQATTPVFHLQAPSVAPLARSRNLSDLANAATARTNIGLVATAPTYQIFTSGSSATYTTPANVKWVRVRMVGGGGGGGGIGGSTAPTGATGGTTSFNSITAIGGTGGSSAIGSVGGAGGTGGSGTAIRINGADGGTAVGTTGVNIPGNGGMGGASAFGGGGAVGPINFTGSAGATNTGGGGAGASGSASTIAGANGGGGGEYAEFIINNPSATYTYTVGAGGAGGIGTGANAVTGGAGAAGRIIVEEHYNY